PLETSFNFSSRRRHTRFSRDWSSDVCSSDLLDQVNQQVQRRAVETLGTKYSLNTRLGELAMRHPVVCSPEMPLRDAVRQMHEQRSEERRVGKECGLLRSM